MVGILAREKWIEGPPVAVSLYVHGSVTFVMQQLRDILDLLQKSSIYPKCCLWQLILISQQAFWQNMIGTNVEEKYPMFNVMNTNGQKKPPWFDPIEFGQGVI